MTSGISVVLLIALAGFLVVLPLVAYTFLVFPNFDGVMQNVKWYTYDDHSQHFLFWTGFWLIVLFGSSRAVRGSKK